MIFIKANENDFDDAWGILTKAREKLNNEKVFQWNDHYPSAQMLRKDLINGDTYFAVENKKRLAFFVINSICEDDVHTQIQWKFPNLKNVTLHRLCVDVSCQGKGIGTAIIKQIEASLPNFGISCMRIDVFGTNAQAIHIYEKLGYHRVGAAVCDRGEFFIYEKKCN